MLAPPLDAPAAAEGPGPEPEAVVRFRALLADEREAARRADTAALLKLQDAKREVLEALKAEPSASSAARASLANEAEGNLALLRQLRQLYEGAFAGGPATYGRVGRRAASWTTRSWGTR